MQQGALVCFLPCRCWYVIVFGGAGRIYDSMLVRLRSPFASFGDAHNFRWGWNRPLSEIIDFASCEILSGAWYKHVGSVVKFSSFHNIATLSNTKRRVVHSGCRIGVMT